MLPATLLMIAVTTVAEPPTDPRKYLDWWYHELEKADWDFGPRDLRAWDRQFKQLESKKPEEREAAVKFLRDVAALSVADDAADKAPHVSRFSVYEVTPDSDRGSTLALTWRSLTLRFFGGGGDKHPEQCPLLAWFLESETEAKLQSKAAAFLDSYTTADADKLRLKLAAGTHPNAVVVAEALKQLPKHKQKLPADELLALCHHHRKQVREAARELNKTQGGKDPGPFDPAKAMASPPVKALMAELEKWTPDVPLPAKDAKLVELTVRQIGDDKKEYRKGTYVGWLIEKKGDTVKFMFPDGDTREFTHGKKSSIQVNGTSDTPVTCDVSTRPAKAQELADAIAELRKEAYGESWKEPELRRGVIIAGGWLVQAGHTAEAAEVLLTELDSYDSDQHLLDSAREEIGEIVGKRMYDAFSYTHDYPEALKLARRIDKVYRGTEYHTLARRFLEELPKRLDDFKTFTLPTPEEWKKLKAKLSREEQIDYLTTRLRLLHLGPFMELTHVPPSQGQYADPERKKPVINPYSELLGGGWMWDENSPKSEGLKLTLKDVPTLSKHLKDDWMTLHWDPFGSFSLGGLTSTRMVVAEIIDSVADHPLCSSVLIREKDWDEMTPKEIDAVIERINKWAKAREAMPEGDLQWELYQQEIKGAESFRRIRRRVEKLLSDKALSNERRAEIAGAMTRLYRQNEHDSWEQKDILQVFRDYDPKAGLKLAEQSLEDRDEDVRFVAAQVIFAAGEKEKGRKLIGNELAMTKLVGWQFRWEPALNLLLKDGGKESLDQAVRLFENKEFVAVYPAHRAEILRLYLAAGRTEPYRFYREQLDDEKSAERFADEITKEFAKDDADVKKIVADHPKAADQIPHLKSWLDGKLKAK